MTNAIEILTENLTAYLRNDTETLKDIVNEINAWNGSLEDLRMYENDEYFFEMYFEGKPMEAVRATQYGDYNYTDYYVTFNGYGNLVSYDTYEYDELIKNSLEEIVEALINTHNNLSLDDDIESMLNLENEVEELVSLHQKDEINGLDEDEIERYMDLVEEMRIVDIEFEFSFSYER